MDHRWNNQQYPDPNHNTTPSHSTLPPGWISVIDPVSSKTYYANSLTGQTSWEPPKLPPPPPPPPVFVNHIPLVNPDSLTNHQRSNVRAIVQSHESVHREQQLDSSNDGHDEKKKCYYESLKPMDLPIASRVPHIEPGRVDIRIMSLMDALKSTEKQQ